MHRCWQGSSRRLGVVWQRQACTQHMVVRLHPRSCHLGQPRVAALAWTAQVAAMQQRSSGPESGMQLRACRLRSCTAMALPIRGASAQTAQIRASRRRSLCLVASRSARRLVRTRLSSGMQCGCRARFLRHTWRGARAALHSLGRRHLAFRSQRGQVAAHRAARKGASVLNARACKIGIAASGS